MFCADLAAVREVRKHNKIKIRETAPGQDKAEQDSTGLNAELDWTKHGSLAVEAVQQSVTLARTEEASRLRLDVDSDSDSHSDSL